MKESNEIAYLDTKEGVDYILSLIKNIDQPLNSQLSSLLQIVCLLTYDTTLVEYLLEKGANPNYLDARGWDARTYVSYNNNPYVPIIIYSILKPYEKKFPKLDPNKRQEEILDWALKKDK